MLSREQQLRSAVESAVAHGWGPALRQVLAFLEDLDRAMSFMTHRSKGSVLGLEPGQRLDRWGMTVRLSERAERDAEFRHELLCNPRYLSALAVHEGLGIKPIDYLWQVEVVNVVEEEPRLHWLILPACHRGCKTLEVPESPPSIRSCQVCGKPVGGVSEDQRVISPEATPEDRIHEVDELIVRMVQADMSSRDRLLANPTGFFAEASQALLGVRPQEAFGIREMRVAAETDTVLCLVLLAKHQSN